MSAETEIHISSRTLALHTNGVFSPTERGHLAHELVLLHRVLKNNSNPEKTFSMREELAERYRQRREELCALLELPPDEKTREKAIQGFDGYLTRVGLPYYRVNLNSRSKK